MLDQQKAFGYTQEDLKFLLAPMVANGEEGTGSMGTDTPISALSEKSKPLYTYFKQNFAQVTNPPIDPIREELVMSLVSFIGPRPNLLDLEGTSGLKRLEVSQPILSNDDLEKIRRISDIEDNNFHAVTLDMTWDAAEGAAGLAARLDELSAQAEHAIAHSHENIIILSDRNISAERVAIPALLATAAVHHHLIRAGLRTQAGLVIETGEAREVHHFCCLAGYGAEAINPYLAFDTVDALRTRLRLNCRAKRRMRITSKPQAKAFARSCQKWVFRPISLIAARRFLMRSGWPKVLSTAISQARQPPLKALA